MLNKIKGQKNKIIKNFFPQSATWKIVLTGLASFVVIVVLLSSSAFVSKLHIVLGEPSPQQINAPYDKDIEDMEKYREDQEAARKSVAPVYKADEDLLSSVAKDMSTMFLSLQDAVQAIQTNPADSNKAAVITNLHQTAPFNVLSNEELAVLLTSTSDQMNTGKNVASEAIMEEARSAEDGAKTDAALPKLRGKMKDLVSQSKLTDSLKALVDAFIDSSVTQPTLIVDEQTTAQKQNAAVANVKLEVYRYKFNQKIVGAGDIVDAKTYRVLEAYGLVKSSSPLRSAGGVGMMTLAGIAVVGFYLYQYRKDIAHSVSRIGLLSLTMSLTLLIGKGIVSINLGGPEYNSLIGMMIPAAWTTMSIAILLDKYLAFIITVVQALFIAIMVDPTLSTATAVQVGLVALFGGLAGVFSISKLNQRSDLARGGLYIGATNIFIISGIAILSGMRLSVWAVGFLLGIVNGLFSSVLTVGTLHWFEAGFNITSSIRLLELSNPNRPLLKRLLMEAPGTYHHSIMVGNLAEAAAEVVNADPILVRVGALYHDIGKLKRPYFFSENQFTQENPHAKIAPTLSALIITSHVKDGLELAKEYKLPEPIQDIIAQHHGEGLVSYFYHRALEESDDVPEENFRYDGPKPQTKEAALVSLADSVEAAVRSMKQPTPGRIEGLVRKIIKDRLNSGQLDQCDLTLQDLDRIAIAFVRVLSGIFHSRVEYPELPARSGQETTAKKHDGKNAKAQKAAETEAADKARKEDKAEDKKEEQAKGKTEEKARMEEKTEEKTEEHGDGKSGEEKEIGYLGESYED